MINQLGLSHTIPWKTPTQKYSLNKSKNQNNAFVSEIKVLDHSSMTKIEKDCSYIILKRNLYLSS